MSATPLHRVEILRGPSVLDELGGELDVLHAETGVGITGRRAWLRAWASTYDDVPVAVTLRDGTSSALNGAALLTTSARRGVIQVRSLGHLLSDRVRFASTDNEAATALADAITGWLGDLRRPWHLHLEHLSPDDPTAVRLAARLPYRRTSTGAPNLWTTIGPHRTFTAHTNSRFRRNLRHAVALLAEHGLAYEVEHHAGPTAIAGVLPDVERIRRTRDAETGVVAELDRRGGRFWQAVTTALGATNELSIAVLRIAGDIAAYVAILHDGNTTRMWDGRIDPRWATYSPGQILHADLLERAILDPTITDIDWGRGDSPYKRRLANTQRDALVLQAWSSPGLLAVGATAGSARRLLAQVKDDNPLLRRAWARARGRR